MTTKQRIQVIEKQVCNYYEVDPEKLYVHNRLSKYVKARYLTWHYSRKIFSITLRDIADQYKRHHTSIIHGLRTVEDSIYTKTYLYHDILALDRVMEEIGIINNMKVVIEVPCGTNWKSLIYDISEKYNVIRYQVV